MNSYSNPSSGDPLNAGLVTNMATECDPNMVHALKELLSYDMDTIIKLTESLVKVSTHVKETPALVATELATYTSQIIAQLSTKLLAWSSTQDGFGLKFES